ncbi:hypothetical protein SAMN05421508_1094 [Caenispirillum bisanense]|uniref:Uncharacterized protein n=1 Tax=Caenispirillum bisanense TaxID=414052 RepID=A0A286GV45_9PROT|nr:hypothetical protein SAMN05421508_1094 [Caenispirillum bisanense]
MQICPRRPNGSSPLERGTLHGVVHVRPMVRFIPARAGNTRPGGWQATQCPLHPRSRGEHGVVDNQPTSKHGSSPLVRGTRPCAAASRRPSTVHPRSCGEHFVNNLMQQGATRFIPARAGNTSSSRPGTRWRAVHPRSCGEHISNFGFVSSPTGSSPPARGNTMQDDLTPLHQPRFIPARAGNKVVAVVDVDPDARFIPARAGNTTGMTKARLSTAVHPRSRGEHAAPDRAPTCRPVHPRSRGEHAERHMRIAEQQRFIPARAGNTCTAASLPPSGSVHPRSRGEHSFSACPISPCAGSSPLARGTRRHVVPVAGRPRFIPARAGNTWSARPCSPP